MDITIMVTGMNTTAVGGIDIDHSGNPIADNQTQHDEKQDP